MPLSGAKLAIALGACALTAACSVAALTSGNGGDASTASVDSASVTDSRASDDARDATTDALPSVDAQEGATDASVGTDVVDAPLRPVEAAAPDGGVADAMQGPPCSAVVPPTGLVGIENQANLRYIEVPVSPPPGSDANAAMTWGTVLDVSSFTGASNQLWNLQAVSDDSGAYRIVNGLSGDCIDVMGGSTQNGTALQQYGCFSQLNQHFWLCSSDAGTVQILGQGSGKCLTTVGNKDQASVYIQDCTSSPTQQWTLAH